jgi:Alpha/beta hydrolase family
MVEAPSREIDAVEGSVRSADGTRIGFLRMGAGLPLVIVPGSLSTSLDWRGVASLLSGRFACLVMDRRGRGTSGDAPAYALQREAEDIAAVLDAAGPGASLVGHSFGAICALETAIGRQVRRLVLYEPPLPVAGPVAGASLAAYREAIAAGRPDEALELGLARFVRLPVEQVAMMRQTSIWPYLRSLAAGWTRELAAIDALGAGTDMAPSPARSCCSSAPRVPRIPSTRRPRRLPAACPMRMSLSCRARPTAPTAWPPTWSPMRWRPSWRAEESSTAPRYAAGRAGAYRRASARCARRWRGRSRHAGSMAAT